MYDVDESLIRKGLIEALKLNINELERLALGVNCRIPDTTKKFTGYEIAKRLAIQSGVDITEYHKRAKKFIRIISEKARGVLV